jgi:hypothetical protein
MSEHNPLDEILTELFHLGKFEDFLSSDENSALPKNRMYNVSLNSAQLQVRVNESEDLPQISIRYPGRMTEWNLIEMIAYFESIKQQNQYLEGPFARLSGDREQHHYDVRNAWDMKLVEGSLSGERTLVQSVVFYMRGSISLPQSLGGVTNSIHRAALFQIDPPEEMLFVGYDSAIYRPETFVPQMLQRHAQLDSLTPDDVKFIKEKISAIAAENNPAEKIFGL